MRTSLLISSLFFTISLSAQNNLYLKPDVEVLRDSPGKIIRTKILFEDRFTGVSVHIAKVFLVRLFESNSNDTITGIELYGNIMMALSPESDFRRKYNVILDYNELGAILAWFDFVKTEITLGKTSDTEKISYSPRKGNLLFRYSREKFEIQFDRHDENSILQLSLHQMGNLIKDFNEIARLKG